MLPLNTAKPTLPHTRYVWNQFLVNPRFSTWGPVARIGPAKPLGKDADILRKCEAKHQFWSLTAFSCISQFLPCRHSYMSHSYMTEKLLFCLFLFLDHGSKNKNNNNKKTTIKNKIKLWIKKSFLGSCQNFINNFTHFCIMWKNWDTLMKWCLSNGDMWGIKCAVKRHHTGRKRKASLAQRASADWVLHVKWVEPLSASKIQLLTSIWSKAAAVHYFSVIHRLFHRLIQESNKKCFCVINEQYRIIRGQNAALWKWTSNWK